MGQRGRKSAQSLTVTTSGEISAVERPQPPDELTDEQAFEWRAIVNRMPADWFPRETWPLLIQYCRHIISARRICQVIGKLEQEEDFDFKAYSDALKIQARESQIITTLATKMRISQQSTYDKSKKKGDGGGAKKPWN